jgi:hypothetical protein
MDKANVAKNMFNDLFADIKQERLNKANILN